MGLKGLANRPFQCQANVLKISGWPILTGGGEKCAGIMRAAFLGTAPHNTAGSAISSKCQQL